MHTLLINPPQLPADTAYLYW